MTAFRGGCVCGGGPGGMVVEVVKAAGVLMVVSLLEGYSSVRKRRFLGWSRFLRRCRLLGKESVAEGVLMFGMEQPAVSLDSHTFVTALNSSFSLVHICVLICPPTEHV